MRPPRFSTQRAPRPERHPIIFSLSATKVSAPIIQPISAEFGDRGSRRQGGAGVTPAGFCPRVAGPDLAGSQRPVTVALQAGWSGLTHRHCPLLCQCYRPWNYFLAINPCIGIESMVLVEVLHATGNPRSVGGCEEAPRFAWPQSARNRAGFRTTGGPLASVTARRGGKPRASGTQGGRQPREYFFGHGR